MTCCCQVPSAEGVFVGLVSVVVANLGGFNNFDCEVVAPVAGAAAPEHFLEDRPQWHQAAKARKEGRAVRIRSIDFLWPMEHRCVQQLPSVTQQPSPLGHFNIRHVDTSHITNVSARAQCSRTRRDAFDPRIFRCVDVCDKLCGTA